MRGLIIFLVVIAVVLSVVLLAIYFKGKQLLRNAQKNIQDTANQNLLQEPRGTEPGSAPRPMGTPVTEVTPPRSIASRYSSK